MIDFASEIKYGADRRFQYAKEHLKDVAGVWYDEVRHIANELHACGYTSQAKKFVELAYLHLHNKDKERYNIVRHQYGGMIKNDY